eukprot:gene1659-2868_t
MVAQSFCEDAVRLDPFAQKEPNPRRHSDDMHTPETLAGAYSWPRAPLDPPTPQMFNRILNSLGLGGGQGADTLAEEQQLAHPRPQAALECPPSQDDSMEPEGPPPLVQLVYDGKLFAWVRAVVAAGGGGVEAVGSADSAATSDRPDSPLTATTPDISPSYDFALDYEEDWRRTGLRYGGK